MPIKYSDSGLDSSILNALLYNFSHSSQGLFNLKFAIRAASNAASRRS